MKDGLLDQVATLRNQQGEIIKMIQAVARVVGTAEVQAEMVAGQRAEMEQAVADAVKDGKLHGVEVSTPTSLVVGTERVASGGLIHPGRFHLLLSDVPDEVRVQLIGRKAGDEIQLPNKNTIKVLEVYDTVATPPESTKKPRKTKKPAAAPTDVK